MIHDTVPGMAEAIEARRAALNLTVEGLAAAAGLTRPGIKPLREGQRRNYSTATLRGVAEALGWHRDWYDRLQQGASGGELIDPDRVASWDHRISSLPIEVQEAIEYLIQGYEARRTDN